MTGYHDIEESLFQSALDSARKIFPLHRSIAGEGIDTAFEELGREGYRIHEFASGTQVLDWIIPPSWRCRALDVRKKGASAPLFRLDHPLRVASHSDSFVGVLSGRDLKRRLRYSKKCPTALVHQYLYYEPGWLISVREDEFNLIEDEADYFVSLDCEKYQGSLKVAERTITGSGRSIAFLSHVCHPAQFNDGLVGVLANLYLMNWVEAVFPVRRFSYKFLCMPETIGSHAYCSLDKNFADIEMAVFTEMTALDQPLHIQMSEREADPVNTYLKLAAQTSGIECKFSPYLAVIRNDEKVFGAPGIDVPSASVTRALGRDFEDHPFSAYHTSLDTIEGADFDRLKEALRYLQTFIMIIESDVVVARKFDGLPMLSRHGLFYNPQTHSGLYNLQERIVWKLRQPKRLSEICLELDAEFVATRNIVNSWAKHELVSIRND